VLIAPPGMGNQSCAAFSDKPIETACDVCGGWWRLLGGK
jgi:hypothetical protein